MAYSFGVSDRRAIGSVDGRQALEVGKWAAASLCIDGIAVSKLRPRPFCEQVEDHCYDVDIRLAAFRKIRPVLVLICVYPRVSAADFSFCIPFFHGVI